MGFTDLLADPILDELERHRYLDIIRRNGTSLMNLINDILDLSKVEAHSVRIQASDIDLKEFLQDIFDLFSQQAEKRGLHFEVLSKTSLPPTLTTDPNRCKQIIVNLVGNAIKFTESGSVCLGVSLLEPLSPEPNIIFEASDTGCGISPFDSKRLFEAFHQADGSSTHKHGGTGLGLAISKRLAMALGGDVYLLKSTPGEGSVFACVLPLGIPFDENQPTFALNLASGAAHHTSADEPFSDTPHIQPSL